MPSLFQFRRAFIAAGLRNAWDIDSTHSPQSRENGSKMQGNDVYHAAAIREPGPLQRARAKVLVCTAPPLHI